MKKRLFAALLALALCLGPQPVMALGTDADFVIDENGVLIQYDGPGGDVTVPDGVAAIGPGAFHNQFGLTSLTIPEGVAGIGKDAFAGCRAVLL